MITKVQPFSKPIVIEFTKLEAEAVSYWLDDIDWDDIHVTTDGCSGCDDEAHYLDTDNYAWNRIEGQAWKWDSGFRTLTVFDEVGLECLMRTKDYCAEADEPVGWVHRYHDWKHPEVPEDQRVETRQGHLAANRAAEKIKKAVRAEMMEAEKLSPARERNARIFELAAFAGSLDANELSQMSAEEILRRLNLKGRA